MAPASVYSRGLFVVANIPSDYSARDGKSS